MLLTSSTRIEGFINIVKRAPANPTIREAHGKKNRRRVEMVEKPLQRSRIKTAKAGEREYKNKRTAHMSMRGGAIEMFIGERADGAFKVGAIMENKGTARAEWRPLLRFNLVL
jgi:hypothetical protein